MSEDAALPAAPELVESYRRLADVFHEVLAEKNRACRLQAFAEDGLRAGLVEIASGASGGCGAKRRERQARRDERSGCLQLLVFHAITIFTA